MKFTPPFLHIPRSFNGRGWSTILHHSVWVTGKYLSSHPSARSFALMLKGRCELDRYQKRGGRRIPFHSGLGENSTFSSLSLLFVLLPLIQNASELQNTSDTKV
jgi:hypothetical protein